MNGEHLPEQALPGDFKKIDQVDIISSNEHWNTYLLSDGNTLKVKLVLVRIGKHPGKEDKYGMPLYGIKTQLVLDVTSPKKK